MDRVLIVSVSEPYGREKIVAVNKLAKQFADLLKQKSFTRKDIERIKALGYEIKTEEVKL